MSPATVAWPGPLFFLLATIALAVLAYLVHRWAFLSGLVSAAGCLTLGWIAARQLSAGELTLLGRTIEIGRPLVVLGRTWALTPSSLGALALVYVLAGLTFFLALSASQGWSFYPFGVCVLGVLSLAITAQQYVYTLLFIWLAANLAVFVLAGGRPGETTAALRFLIFTSLAVMLLLLLPRYLEPDPAGYVVALTTGEPALPDNALQIASWLMVGGMAMLLMMVPFSGSLVAMGAHSTPMALPLILTVFPVVALHTLFRLWQAQPVLMDVPIFFQVCRSAGIAAAALGGLAAIGQRRWGALAGYAALVDWGAGLIALGQGTAVGADLAVRMALLRAWSLLLVGTGWSALFKALGRRDDLERCGGLLRRQPLSVLALLVGLFSLAGYPLTPGALGRWPLLSILLANPVGLPTSAPQWVTRLIGRTPAQPSALVALLLAGVGIGIGVLSGVRACLGSPQRDGSEAKNASTANNAPVQETEPSEESGPTGLTGPARVEAINAVVSSGFALLALWLVGGFFLSPQPWLELGQALLSGVAWPGG